MTFPGLAGGKVHPLSLEQRTIYAVGALSPELVLDERLNLFAGVRVRGPLRPELVQAAFDDLVARHGALRTRPAQLPDGDIVQEEFPEARHPVALGEAEGGEAELPALLDRLSDTRISCREPPFARVSLFRLGEGDHLLFLALQHVACDVTGLYLALADLARAYQARAEGGRLGPLAWSYGDHARWQVEHHAERLAGDLQEWERYLAGLEPYEVRQDVPFTPGPPGVMGKQLTSQVLDAGVFGELQRFALRQRTTTFVTLLAAFHLALSSRTSSQERLSATYFDQRDHPATREMVGYFLRPAFVRSSLPPDRRLGEVLGSMTRLVVEAHRRAHVPFAEVVGVFPAALPALLGQSPPWCFLLQYLPQAVPSDLRFGEARGMVIHAGVNAPQEPGFSLGLRSDEEGRLVLRTSHDPAQWHDSTMRALAGDLRRALSAMVKDPSRTVADLASPPGAW